ncbi:MAG: competence protein ComEC [Frankiaceae bacterium]|nr:competence protein ComEC [Frankiaceae bacterium]
MIAIPAASCWGAAAMLLGRATDIAGVVAIAAGVGTASALALRRLTLAWVLVGVTIGATATALHLHALRTAVVSTLIGRRAPVPVEMTLVRDPVELTSAHGFRFVLAAATVSRVAGRPDRAPVTVLAHGGAWLGLLPGQRLRVQARIRAPRSGDPVAAVVLPVGDPLLVGRPPLWQRVAGRVRAAFRAATTQLPTDERGLVPGLVIGDTAAMPADLVEAFRSSGLTHLNAVSGENVAVVLATVGAVLRRTWAGRRTRAALALLAIVGFVVLARPSPSVLRAAVMGAIVVAGSLAGRRGHALPALAAAVIALISVDPFLARAPGFALSVLATAAIVVAARPVADRLSHRLPRPLAIAVAVPLVAQVACTPVLVAAFGQLSPWAVPANVLAAPAVAPATVAGVVCALLAVPLPAVASAVAWLAAVPAGWLALVARAFAAMPGAGLRLPTGVTALAAAGTAAMLAVLLAGGVRRQRRLRAMLGAWPP